jgi:hypothetical protein
LLNIQNIGITQSLNRSTPYRAIAPSISSSDTLFSVVKIPHSSAKRFFRRFYYPFLFCLTACFVLVTFPPSPFVWLTIPVKTIVLTHRIRFHTDIHSAISSHKVSIRMAFAAYHLLPAIAKAYRYVIETSAFTENI